MPMTPPPELSSMSLAEVAQALADNRLPPVDKWNPTHCGPSDMRIARDGTWFHPGSPISRPAMVRLFATILRREADGSFVLVTPGEKLDIEVEDAPFVAIELKSEGSGRDRRLAFGLNTGELVVAGADNALRFEARGLSSGGPSSGGDVHPYLHVRGGLDALVSRPVYYELAELALSEGSDGEGVWSNGAYFPMSA